MNAQTALTAARDAAAGWRTALENALAERDKLAAPATPDGLDAYADAYARAEGKIIAARAGIDTADAQIITALENVVRADLETAKADMVKAEKARDAHGKKVAALLAHLDDLDDAPYIVKPLNHDQGARQINSVSVDRMHRTGKLYKLGKKATDARQQVAMIHAALETRHVPADRRGELPASVREWIDAMHDPHADGPTFQDRTLWSDAIQGKLPEGIA